MYTLFLYDDNTAVGQQSTREEKTGHMASFYTRSLWDVPRSERHIVVMMKFCCKKVIESRRNERKASVLIRDRKRSWRMNKEVDEVGVSLGLFHVVLGLFWLFIIPGSPSHPVIVFVWAKKANEAILPVTTTSITSWTHIPSEQI